MKDQDEMEKYLEDQLLKSPFACVADAALLTVPDTVTEKSINHAELIGKFLERRKSNMTIMSNSTYHTHFRSTNLHQHTTEKPNRRNSDVV